MFNKNHRHLQIPLTSHVEERPEKLRKRLENSWAGVFYRDFLCRIDETLFAELYADCPARPNGPVNVLVGLEFLKAGNGRTDEKMYDNFCYDTQVRYALGYRQLGEGDFELLTLYYFRERLSRHMQERGVNLLDQAFEHVTDAQIVAYQVKIGKHLRGEFRISCMLIGSAAVANLLRIQRYLEGKKKAEKQQGVSLGAGKNAQEQPGFSILPSPDLSWPRFATWQSPMRYL